METIFMKIIISIIVPVYNVEKYLSRCIDSILSQTFTDFELILVNDGSPDNCGKICDDYATKDNRVKVIHKENTGVSDSRNKGLDIANGRYITFCDSDDYVDDDWLERLYKGTIRYDVDSYSMNFRCVNEDKDIESSSEFAEKLSEVTSDEEAVQYLLFDILGGGCGWAIWTRLFKRSIIEKYSIRFCQTCGNYAEDMAFVLEYAVNCCKFYTESYCGYNYYQRKNSMMGTSHNIIKLNEVSESAHHVIQFLATHYGTRFKTYFPVLFFRMMRTEYFKLLNNNAILTLPDEINKIENQKWFRKMNRKVIRSYFTIKKLHGKDYAKKTFLISSFCLHKNVRLYGIQSALYYKLK